jgi:NADPH-dependent glutamate synthase beta subunit-like oxidoreductase
MKQLAFYFDQTRCMGCEACVVACKDWNDVAPGPASWRKISTIEKGKYPHPIVAHFSNACYHCSEPSCVSVCPAGAITKREEDGIVMVDRGKCREAGRCGIISAEAVGSTFTYEEGKSPCQIACPAHLSVPGYVALIGKGKFKEALTLIREKMPLPSVCGRVCLAPCEKECSRQKVDQAIAIAALKRFVTDYVEERSPAPLPQTNGKRVAIIGSGPAGLAAAHELIRKGYGVTVYEAAPVAGGMLATGIPSYRLPKEILKRDIDYIKALGVEIKTSTPLGPELTLDDLVGQGYAAVLLAMGAPESTKLKVPGADLEGTMVATSFLWNFNSGNKVEIGERVVVIGGGNVAIDCGRAAVRLGAVEVHLACLESRAEMPAQATEIEAAEEEGVVIHPSVTVESVLGSRSVTGINCLNVRNVTFDENGEPHMEILKGTEHVVPADTLIFAVGQAPNLSCLCNDKLVQISRRGTVVADPEAHSTACQGIFACGDVVSGPTNVIEAIASGQRAASYIDRYVRGRVLRGERAQGTNASEVKIEIPADIAKQERQPMPHLSISERHHNFREVALGYGSETAMAEAKRCLNCAGHLCKDVCPYNAPQFGAEEKPKMQKCDFCSDRWAEDEKPVCVDACPMRALDAGPLDEIKSKYGSGTEAMGFAYSSETMPCVVFKVRW